jgi:hypothetical protein
MPDKLGPRTAADPERAAQELARLHEIFRRRLPEMTVAFTVDRADLQARIARRRARTGSRPR